MTSQNTQVLYALQKKVLEEMVHAILPLVEEDLELETGCILDYCFLIEEQELPLFLKDREPIWSEEDRKSWYLQGVDEDADLYILAYSIEGHNQELLPRPGVNGRPFSWEYIAPFLIGLIHECRHFWQFFMYERYEATGEHNFIHDLFQAYHDSAPEGEAGTDKYVSGLTEYVNTEMEKDSTEYSINFLSRYEDQVTFAILPRIEKMESILKQPEFFREDLLQEINQLAQPSEEVQNEV